MASRDSSLQYQDRVTLRKEEDPKEADLAQGSGEEAVEGRGPVLFLRELRGGLSGNHEDDAHGVDRPARGRYLCHLYGAHSQSPHIHLSAKRTIKLHAMYMSKILELLLG